MNSTSILSTTIVDIQCTLVFQNGPFTGTYGDYRLFFCEWVKFFVLIEQTLIRSDLNKGYQQMIKANRKILSNE